MLRGVRSFKQKTDDSWIWSVWEDEQRGFGLGLNLKELKIVNAFHKRQGTRPFSKETSET